MRKLPAVVIAAASIAIFGGSMIAYASYTPGQTLNPSCAPGTAGCDVTLPTTPEASNTSTGTVQLSGDIGGSATSVKVTGLQGNPVSASTPSSQQVLTWNGSQWVPQAVSSSSSGLNGITGLVYANGTSSPTVATGLQVSNAVYSGSTLSNIIIDPQPQNVAPTSTSYNVILGVGSAINLDASGVGNEGNGNVILGSQAVPNASELAGSVIIGHQAAYSFNATGTLGTEVGNNTVIGANAGGDSKTMNECVIIGQKAYGSGAGCKGSIFIGTHNDGFTNSTHDIVLGLRIGDDLGSSTLVNSGGGNVLMGTEIFNCMYNPNSYGCTTTGANPTNDTIIGNTAGGVAMFSKDIVAVGNAAGVEDQSVGNVWVGDQAGEFNTTGESNVGIGYQSLGKNTTGSLDTCGGYLACFSATSSASWNTAWGYTALKNTTGGQDTAVGAQAFENGTYLGQDVGVGYHAGINETSHNNTYVGSNAGSGSPTGGEMVAIGSGSGQYGTETQTPSGDTLIGYASRCPSCTSSEALGSGADIGGAISGAGQIGGGTNSNANTLQFQSWNLVDNSGNLNTKLVKEATSTIASAATIAPTTGLVTLTGSSTVSTITVPTIGVSGGSFTGCINIIATGASGVTTGGNIANAVSFSANSLHRACYNGTKWYVN